MFVYQIYVCDSCKCSLIIIRYFLPVIGIHMVAELGSIPLEDLRDRKGGKIEILRSEKF